MQTDFKPVAFKSLLDYLIYLFFALLKRLTQILKGHRNQDFKSRVK